MQDDFHASLERRLPRLFQKSPVQFQNFGGQMLMSWGLETRTTFDRYDWDGMKRGLSPRQPHLLFQYTLRGRGAYAEAGRTWELRAGHAFTVLLPSPHRYYLPRDSESWTFFWFIVQHPFVIERMRALRKIESAVQEWPEDSAARHEAVSLFEAACQNRWRDVWSFERHLIGWLLETERDLDRRRYPSRVRRQWEDEVRASVRARLPGVIDVPELATQRRMERTTFSRKFKSATGLSPAAFVTQVRLEEATRLLRSDRKLEQIAAETGFADANHFCKVFRRHFHSSPGSYRRVMLRN